MKLARWWFCCLLLVLPAASAPGTSPVRVVAVADVHGDLVNFKAMLRDAGIMDAQDRWIAGDTVLVQTGDVLDKGPDSRGVLELLMSLEEQAGKAGGKLVTVLGNHEIMNIAGDLRYVSAEEWASYADADAPQRRQAALAQWKAWTKRRGAGVSPAMEAEWLERHPLGFIEQREAFGPRGRYGKWLRGHPVVAQVGDTVFLHGGLAQKFAALSPEQINRRVAEELRTFDRALAVLLQAGAILPFFTFEEIVSGAQQLLAECKQVQAPAGDVLACEDQRAALEPFLKYPEWLSISRDGPVWFRGFADWSDEEGAPQVAALLQAQHAARFVVGHTYSGGRIRMRWDGKVFLIDTGLLQHPMYPEPGRRSALEIVGARITAIYADGKVVLVPDPGATKAQPKQHQEH